MIRLRVDLTNPGQFFACCGLFELGQRLWAETVAHFEGSEFVLSSGDLDVLVARVATSALTCLDPIEHTASPMQVGTPFGLRLDWWKDRAGGGAALKPWAGTMQAGRIARAMQVALPAALAGDRFLDHGAVVTGPDGNKVEPYYFDGRRGANALPLDVGFSPDALQAETLAYPATEFLALIGLQRFRPAVVRPRLFRYRTWGQPLPIALAALASCGALHVTGRSYKFENAFRTDQRKHKAFSPAVRVNGDRDE